MNRATFILILCLNALLSVVEAFVDFPRPLRWAAFACHGFVIGYCLAIYLKARKAWHASREQLQALWKEHERRMARMK